MPHRGMGYLNSLLTPFNFRYETHILQMKSLMLVTCSWCGLAASTIREPHGHLHRLAHPLERSCWT